MAYHAHSLSEWAEMVSLATAGFGVYSVFFHLLVESTSARDFDPRPAVRRAVESGRLDPLLIEAVRARQFLRETAVSVAALLMLLTVAPEATS